jgi:hypothetical protein
MVTITIDNPWMFLCSVILGLILLVIALGLFSMGALTADGGPPRWFAWTLGLAITASALILMCAGGGWL